MATDDDSDVPATGAVFTYGKSKFNENVPGKFWIRDDKVIQVSCGDEHTALVAESGRVFTFGENVWGQLGLGHKNSALKPSRLKSLKNEPIKLVACGRSHTIFASKSGKLYCCGANVEAQLGLGNTSNENVTKPVHISTIADHSYKMLSAGVEHSAALTESGDVYIWGCNSEGQTGHGSEAQVTTPTKVEMEEEVVSISCGYYHTALVTASGKLYTFGENENDKLGQGSEPADHTTPQEVTGLHGKVVSVSCGGSFTVAVLENGKVVSFGDGANGQLGHGTLYLQRSEPAQLALPKSVHMKMVSCGDNHAALVTDKGRLYTCGDGRHGKLALGEENFANQFKPLLVDRFAKFVVEGVSCGGCHMLVLATPRTEDSWEDSEEELAEEVEDHLSNKQNGIDAIMRNEGLSASMDPAGSIAARNRRREKLPDPSNTINRTLPPLTSSVHLSSSTLPPLGGGDHQDGPLSRTRLAPIGQTEAPDTFSAKKPDHDSGGESEGSSEDENKPTTNSLSALRSLPQAKPRIAPRKGSSLQSQPVPARRKPVKKPESDDDESEEEESEEEVKKKTKSKKTKEDLIQSEEEDRGEDEEEEDSVSKKKKEAEKKKKEKEKEKKKKKMPVFGKKKVQVPSEDDEEEDDEDEEDEEKEESTQKSGKSKEKVKKEKAKKDQESTKKKKSKTEQEDEEDDEEGSEEEEKKVSDQQKKNAKKKAEKAKAKSKIEEDQEAEEEEKENDIKDNAEKEANDKAGEQTKEEKKEEPKKKSRTCTLL